MSKNASIRAARKAKAKRQAFESGDAWVRPTKRAKRTKVQPKA